MSINLEEYNRIKKAADDRRKEVDQAEGAYNQLLKDLKEEFGCDSIEAAEAKLVELEVQEKAAEEAYQTELTTYKEKWGDLLR